MPTGTGPTPADALHRGTSSSLRRVFRRYTGGVSDTTIKVTTDVRDRLAILARERGCTIGQLVGDLAGTTPTREELDARYTAAADYIREHLCPDLTEDDLAAGEQFWQDLEAGRPVTL